jgi:hypothetical protein
MKRELTNWGMFWIIVNIILCIFLLIDMVIYLSNSNFYIASIIYLAIHGITNALYNDWRWRNNLPYIPYGLHKNVK